MAGRLAKSRVKWVRDGYLDQVVEREKNLKHLISLKDQIVSSPSKSLPLSTAATFFQRHASVFTTFHPSPHLPLHVRLTPQALALHHQELAIHLSPTHRLLAVQRLAKFLMLARAQSLPLTLLDRFRFDLGLPHDYLTSLVPDFPDYFQLIHTKDQTLALALSSWRSNLAVSHIETTTDTQIRYSMNFPKGYDLDKWMKNWMEQWQRLPYISPYENAFHLPPYSDQADKWAVALLHELLSILVSKKTETNNVLCLGEYLGLGFGVRFKEAIVHHPGLFYMSHKIRTQTLVLREAYHKAFLLHKHPLMGMRHRYIYLMTTSKPVSLHAIKDC